MKLKLIIENSNVVEKGKSYIFAPGEILLGRREQGNHIVIPENAISRTHLKITLDNKGNLFAEDLESGNGSFINDKKFTGKIEVKPGSKIKLGSTVISLNIEGLKKPLKTTPKEESKKSKAKPAKTKKNKANYLLYSGLFILVFILLILLFKNLGAPEKTDPDLLKNTYLLSEAGIKFKYPDGFKRMDKSKSASFGITYFPRHELLFGKTSAHGDILFAIDVLETLPGTISLDDIVKTDDLMFPRLIPHNTKHISVNSFSIQGLPAKICETDVFSFLGKKLKAIELFFIHKNRRFLVLAFASSNIFNSKKQLLLNMINSISLEDYTDKIKPPDNPRAEARRIIKLAEDLVQRKGIKPENLYLANQKYAEAAVILNRFDYRENDTLLKKLIIDFKTARKELDHIVKDYRFTIKKGLKIKEYQDVFEAAKKIMALIPDPLDKNYQFAEKHYNRLKQKFKLH